jgi:multidrug efflux pump subunit AcrA (membrane-fusion protein)
MQEESEELLDDAEKDEELAAEEAAAAAAAAKVPAALAEFRASGSRQFGLYAQGRQASQNVQDLLARAQSSVKSHLLPEVVAERQRKQQQQQQLLQQQKQQDDLARRAGDPLYEEARFGPFGTAVAKANALRKQRLQPMQRVEGEGEGMSAISVMFYSPRTLVQMHVRAQCGLGSILHCTWLPHVFTFVDVCAVAICV